MIDNTNPSRNSLSALGTMEHKKYGGRCYKADESQ